MGRAKPGSDEGYLPNGIGSISTQPRTLRYPQSNPSAKGGLHHCILFEMQDGVPVLDMKYVGQREGRADVKDEYRYYEELGLLFEGCCQEMVSGRAR